MLFVEPFARNRLRRSAMLFVLIAASAVFATPFNAQAQAASTTQAPISATKASAALLTPKPMGPQWNELSGTQKQILSPLATSWDTLSSGHKSKWIAVAQNYPNRTPAEQVKLQSRMAEWAALTANQRERARLNFAETKMLSASERAANWEAYQGLSSQEKRKLASKGKRPIVHGGANGVKPPAPGKITPVPITRHTTGEEGGQVVTRPRIDPHTLLPLPPEAPSSAAAPALTSASAPR